MSVQPLSNDILYSYHNRDKHKHTRRVRGHRVRGLRVRINGDYVNITRLRQPTPLNLEWNEIVADEHDVKKS